MTKTQAEHLESILLTFPKIPKSILQVAYQPTGRGGRLHYVAGNIRFVHMARELLDAQRQGHILATPDPWMMVNIEQNQGDEVALWWDYLKYENNVDEEDKHGEQLLIVDQVFYTCLRCGSSTWV